MAGRTPEKHPEADSLEHARIRTCIRSTDVLRQHGFVMIYVPRRRGAAGHRAAATQPTCMSRCGSLPRDLLDLLPFSTDILAGNSDVG